MSCFHGLLGGYLDCFADISVDNFSGYNLNSKVFFLSHFHTDHMKGLEKDTFIQTINSTAEMKIYMSEITKGFVLNEWNLAPDSLKNVLLPLPLNCRQKIQIPSSGKSEKLYDIYVTFFHARHCAGSVMILFERLMNNNFQRLLYTGDIRLCPDDFTCDLMPDLYTDSGVLKNVDVLCIDTTFCVETQIDFPSISSAVDVLRQYTKRFINEDHRHRILLLPAARTGHEELLDACCEALDYSSKVHMDDKSLRRYRHIQEMSKIITDSPSVPVHCCAGTKAVQTLSMLENDWCPKGLSEHMCNMNVTIIKPSTMYFIDNQLGPDQVFFQDNKLEPEKKSNVFHLWFSKHSSFRELRGIVTLLNPLKIIANVSPVNSSTKEAELLLQRCISMAYGIPQSIDSSGSSSQPIPSSWTEISDKQKKADKAPVSSKNMPSSFKLVKKSVKKKRLVQGRLVTAETLQSTSVDISFSHANTESKDVIYISSDDDVTF